MRKKEKEKNKVGERENEKEDEWVPYKRYQRFAILQYPITLKVIHFLSWWTRS